MIMCYQNVFNIYSIVLLSCILKYCSPQNAFTNCTVSVVEVVFLNIANVVTIFFLFSSLFLQSIIPAIMLIYANIIMEISNGAVSWCSSQLKQIPLSYMIMNVLDFIVMKDFPVLSYIQKLVFKTNKHYISKLLSKAQ